MKFLGINFGKQEPTKDTVRINVTSDMFKMFSAQRPELPLISEDRKYDWVNFGEKNDYPKLLVKYLSTSAIHSAIITTKAKMQCGNDILFNEMTFADYTVNLPPKDFEIMREF